MGISVAIIDDEQHCLDRMLHLLAPHAHRFDIRTYQTMEQALEGLMAQRPDIVFLDVQLGGHSGFDLLVQLGFADFGLIFTTAHEKYAIEAFRFSAMAYLLKPVERDEFEGALQRALERTDHGQLKERIEVLLAHITKERGPRRISIPHREGYIFPMVGDIVRCQADVNYTHIHCVDGRKYTVSKTLKHYEQLLPPQQFLRIHNSHLINLDYVASYDRNGYA